MLYIQVLRKQFLGSKIRFRVPRRETIEQVAFVELRQRANDLRIKYTEDVIGEPIYAIFPFL